MARTLSPTANDVLEFDERFVDGDGDTLTVDFVELNAVDGADQSGADRAPSWLSFSTSSQTLSSGASELIVTVEADTSGLTNRTVYEFEVKVSDPSAASQTVLTTLNVRPSEAAAPHIWHRRNNELRKYRAEGDTPQFTQSLTDAGFGALSALDNNMVVVGMENRIRAFDSFQNQLWESTRPGGNTRALSVGTDNFIYYADQSGKVEKLSQDGELVNTIASGLDEAVQKIIPLEDGGVALGRKLKNLRVIEPDGSTRFTAGTQVEAVGGRNGGSLIVVAESNSFPGNVIAYDSEGNQLWSVIPGNEADLNLSRVAVAPNHEIIAVSHNYRLDEFDVYNTDQDANALVYWLDFDGNVIANIQEDPPVSIVPRESDVEGFQFGIDFDEKGNFYSDFFITFENESFDRESAASVMKHDKTGALQWRHLYSTGASGDPEDQNIDIGVPRALG